MSRLHKLLGFLVLVMATAVAIPLTLAQPQGGLKPQAYLPVVMTGCNDSFDDFDDPNSGWPVVDDDLVTLEYVNSEYRIFSKQAGYVFRPLAPFPGHENYVVEVDVRFNGTPTDGFYGLIFGVVTAGTEVTDYYMFAVLPDTQTYILYRFERGATPSFREIISDTMSAAINPGTAVNHLMAVRDGAEITLAVNGITLTTLTNTEIVGPTYTGVAMYPLAANPQADARFDNFHVHICVRGGSGGRTAASFHQATPFTVSDAFDLE